MRKSDYFDKHARKYDASMRIFGRPLPRTCELVTEALSDGAKVLEVAAGTGLVTRAIAKKAREVVATDYAEGMVEVLKRRAFAEGLANVQCQQADVYALPFEPASFDAVVAANVLHLVPNLEKALEALKAAARPGGKVIVPTFCHAENLGSQLVSRVLALTGFPGQRRFSLASLERAVRDAGLNVVRTELVPGILPIGYVEAVRPA